MPMIITLPDELAKKLQSEADARQQSINELAIDFLERALEDESFDTQSDFKMLGAQMRATPTPAPAQLSKEPSETKANHNDDASDFEKIGDKIRSSPPRRGEPPSQGWGGLRGGERGDDGATLSSASSSAPLDGHSNQTCPDEGRNGSDFKTLGVQLKGRAAAIASTGWLLDPSVSPINDHKYRVDLEGWSRLWAKVKVEMKYEQSPT